MDSEPRGTITASRAGRIAEAAALRQCVHCGLCLTACPTYLELGTEMDSPRGRLHLVKAIEDGSAPLTPEAARHLDLCLGCRACEPACPSGVPYGRILEDARAYMAGRDTDRRRRWRRTALLAVFPHSNRLRLMLLATRIARRLGVWHFAERWSEAAALVPAERSRARLSAPVYPALGRERARVALLRGCVGDVLFADTNAAAVRVLTRAGVSVVVPRAQGCCGALHLHAGERDAARELARRTVHAFPDDVDAVVVTAAGCGAAMKGYAELLADDPLAAAARRFAARVRDVTEYAVGLELPALVRPLRMRATYHDACHLAHAQGVRSAPRELLARIRGLELVSLAESDVCCGSAGSYNLTEPAMARRLRERKIDHIAATGATCVVAANPGCTLQIRAGLAARGLPVRVAHPIELVAEALGS
jgi:glycolate oxidase iron-sulfur subunit